MRRSTSRRSLVPQIRIQSGFAEKCRFDLVARIAAAEAKIDQLHYRHAAGALGREGAFLARVGDVDHASVLVRRNRDSAAQMSADQPQRLVGLALLASIALGDRLGIKRMRK